MLRFSLPRQEASEMFKRRISYVVGDLRTGQEPHAMDVVGDASVVHVAHSRVASRVGASFLVRKKRVVQPEKLSRRFE